MIISKEYQQHIELMKSVQRNADYIKARQEYENSFDAIYNQAKEKNVDLDNATDFLNSLSKEELTTLQKHALLADEIKIDKLSKEGAYNLLVHNYEQYDFNNDGLTDVGEGQLVNFLPNNMPYEDKKAFIESYNELEDNEKLHLAMTMLPNIVHVEEDGSITQVSQSYSTLDSLQTYFNELLNSKMNKFNEEIRETLFKFKKLLEHYDNESSKESDKSKKSYYPSSEIVAHML